MWDWLSNAFDVISDIIAQLTAITTLAILVILFFIFDFKFLIRAYVMLRKMFKHQRMPFVIAFTLPWQLKKINKDDKNAKYDHLKEFCEYTIFMTRGKELSTKEWASLVSKYKYEHLLSEPFLVKVDSTFELLNEDVDALIRKYFAFLNKNYKKYFHNKSKSKFVCKLSFDNGFVYPASFINGLERKFSDSWTDLLVKYNYTLKNSKYCNAKASSSIIKNMHESDTQNFVISQNNNAFDIKSNELFMMYSWLMWSPSYQMNYDDNYYKIILYGIGDESNTTNLVLDTTDEALELWERLKQSMANNTYGVNLSIDCELYEFNPYISENLHNFSVETTPIINNLLNNSNDIHYILSYVSPSKDANLKSTSYIDDNDAFFSGYLWALYGRQDKEHTQFDIKNSVSFFEHTNLADSTSVDYFTKSMAQKTILHFKEVLQEKNPSKYTLHCCVANSFKEKYISLMEDELKKEDKAFVAKFYQYVDLKDDSVTINEIFENIDEEFPLNNFEFRRVDNESDIANFYANIYIKNFAPDERDSLDDLIHRTLYLKSNNHHDMIFAYQNGQIVGGIVFDWFASCNCGLIEYLVVDNQFRGMRIAQRLVAKATAQMSHYAGKKPLNAIFIEIEDPEKLTGLTAQAAFDNYRRLKLWSNNRFEKVDINYIQPALDEGLNKLDNLMLAVNTLKSDSEYIDAEILKNFLIDFNRICNRIEDIDDPDVGVKEMLDEIDAKENGQVKILQNSIDFEKYKPKRK